MEFYTNIMEEQTSNDMTAVQLSQKQISELFWVFSLYDRDGDGKIAMKELKTTMSIFGGHLTEAELQYISWDWNGTIGFPEFIILMVQVSGIKFYRFDEYNNVLESRSSGGN